MAKCADGLRLKKESVFQESTSSAGEGLYTKSKAISGFDVSHLSASELQQLEKMRPSSTDSRTKLG